MKKCCHCKEFKSATSEYFYRDKTQKDGLSPRCKECGKEYSVLYYQNNRQRLIEYRRQQYRKNPQATIEVVRRYKKQNPEKGEGDKEKHLERGRKYYHANIEKRQEYMKDWNANNREKTKNIAHRRRARVEGNGGSYTPEEWQLLCTRYNYRCLSCGEEKPLTVDHVIPISKGGKNTIDNIQPLCKSCNSKKHNKIIDYRL